MRLRFRPTWWLIIALMLALALVACERPLQDEPDLTLEPAPSEGDASPGYPGAETLAAPGLLPTPTVSAPAPGAGDGDEPPGEQVPAEEGETDEETTEGETQPPGDVIHTVIAGDTLGNLAQQYGVTIEAIAAANNLANIHTLDVGQQLLIPLSGDTGEEEPGAEEAPGGEETGAEERVHIVRAGDSLFRIGQQYGFTIEELATYNELANPDRLEIGQEIRIPPEGYTVDP